MNMTIVATVIVVAFIAFIVYRVRRDAKQKGTTNHNPVPRPKFPPEERE